MNTVDEKNLILTRAKSAVLSRDFVTAARLYKQMLKKDPSNVDYLKELGSIYVKAGEDAKAIPYYEQIITFYPHYVEAMNSLGAIYRRLKRYEDSINILQKALDEDRQTGSVNYNLGFTYKEMGNYDDAIEAFEIVITENPSDVLAYNHIGKIYFAKKDYAKAISSYKKGLQVDQNHPILNYNLAVCYDEAKMYPEAIRCYEAALKAKPGWVDAIRDFSTLLITCQRTKEASELVHHSIELYPNDSQLLCLLGRIYLSQFDYDSAIKTYKKAAVFAGNDIRVLTGLAEALEKGEKPQEALDSVIKAMELEPDNKDLKKQYVHTLLSAEEYEAAGINVKELESEPEGAKDLEVLDLGEQYSICVNDEEKAQEYSDKIVKINKHYKNHILEAAGRYAQIGNNEMAEKKAKEFVAREIRNPAGYNMLGKIYTSTGDLQNAIDSYDKSRSFRKPNILADKQIKKLTEQMNKLQNPEQPPVIEEEKVEEQVVEEAPAVEENEDAEQQEEEDFDFNQLGGNVPMQEALVEDEDEFFENLDNLDDLEDVEEAEEEEPEEPEEPEKPMPVTFDGEALPVAEGGGGNSGAASEDPDDFDFGQFDKKDYSDPEYDNSLFGNDSEDYGAGAPAQEQPVSQQPMANPEPAYQEPQNPEPAYREPEYPPQYQKPDPYAEEMQKRLQDAMMQSSRFAMDTAMEAQKLARQLADEQEVLKNRLNEMEEKQASGFYNKQDDFAPTPEEIETAPMTQEVMPEEAVPEEMAADELGTEGIISESAEAEENALEDVLPDNEAFAGEPVAGDTIIEDALADELTDAEPLDEPDTGSFVGNEMLTDDETESLIGEMGDEDYEAHFPIVDDILQELTQEPEDLIPEVDDVSDIDFDAIEEEPAEAVFNTVEDFDEAVPETEVVEVVDESEAAEVVDASVEEFKEDAPEPEAVEIAEPVEEKTAAPAEILLPAIEKVLEDDEEANENAPEIEMFKKLISLSDYLPEDEKEKFRTGKQRMQMEYLISKMSGKPGLLKTSQSLRKTGVLGEVDAVTSDESGNISNQSIKDVIGIMKKLSADLEDKNLAKALCSSADNVLEKIELEDKKSQIFVS